MNPADIAAIATAVVSVITAITSLIVSIRTKNTVTATTVKAPADEQ